MNALTVKDLHVKINESHILHGVSFEVPTNKVTALLGRNGVGKSTTLRTIMGFYEGTGSVELNGKQILGMQTHKIVQSGVAFVPEDREIFASLTVKENLSLAARSKDSADAYKFVYDLFPEVKDIIKQVSKTAKVDRVRIMKLEAGKVIEQHTDLVDSECGIGIGEVPRFHIPIDTHDDCWFEVYGMTGKEVFKFKEGELWYLDTRKPHRVVNNGKTRIHLVFDLYTDADLLNKLKQRKLT